MDTDKIAVGLLVTVQGIAACVAGCLLLRDFIRKHRKPRKPDGIERCECGLPLNRDGRCPAQTWRDEKEQS